MKRRWVDSLADTDSTGLADLAEAAVAIVYALHNPKSLLVGDYLAEAGAIIRNKRKLSAKALRWPDRSESASDEDLLWSALEWVALAAQLKGHVAAQILRGVEADLRTLWKRSQS